MKFKLIVCALCILVQQSHGQLAKSKGNKDISALESEIFSMNATGITTDDTKGTTESIDNTGLPTTIGDAGSATESEVEDNYYTPYQGERLDDFDWLITRQILLKNDANIIISPFSVKLLMLLLSEAASGDSQTQKELKIIFPIIRRPYFAREVYKQIFKSLEKISKDYVFESGTSIFVDNEFTPQQQYSSNVLTHYRTTVDSLDFTNAHESAEIINSWCSNITKGHIKELVNDDAVRNSIMIMVNAIYFKGVWRRPFPKENTRMRKFNLVNNQQVDTRFMEQTATFYFVDSAEFKAKLLRIPYKGRKFAMILVLPNEDSSLEQVVKDLNSRVLNHAIQLMSEYEVNVKIPKLKFDYSANLNTPLQELGIREIFTQDASLPLLSRGPSADGHLRVSNVVQKAGLILDEEGSTAYAATEIELVNKFGGDTTRDFIADRPFLFYIEDESVGTVLFAGKVTNPAQLQSASPSSSASSADRSGRKKNN